MKDLHACYVCSSGKASLSQFILRTLAALQWHIFLEEKTYAVAELLLLLDSEKGLAKKYL